MLQRHLSCQEGFYIFRRQQDRLPSSFASFFSLPHNLLGFPIKTITSSIFRSMFEFTQVETEISKYHRLLASSPRSDPHRPILLLQLAGLRTMRRELSHQKDDHDKAVTHFTEAILLPFQQGGDVVNWFFQLASILSSRFWVYKQPEDIKSSLKYFRFLRNNFHSRTLEASDIPHYLHTSRHVRALAHNLTLGFGDVEQDMEELATLSHELLTSDSSGGSRVELRKAIAAFTFAAATTLAKDGSTQQPSDCVLQALREATIIIPDLVDISLVLASCHLTRFKRTLAIKEYEEVIAIADKIICATGHLRDDSLTPPTHEQEIAIGLIMELVVHRLNSFSNAEDLEDSIRRIRILISAFSLPDQTYSTLISLVDILERKRFGYFGVTGSSTSVERPLELSKLADDVISDRRRALTLVGAHEEIDGDRQSLLVRSIVNLRELLESFCHDKMTDVEATVACGRALLPSLPSLDRVDPMLRIPGVFFADILFEAYQRTKRLDYLNEAITRYRNHLQNGSGIKKIHFLAVYGLVCSLIWRFKSCRHGQDLEEAMQLYAMLADHEYVEVFNRFYFSCSWARRARLHAHPSILTAYEKAMSLLQETIVFSPTLQTQHFRLAHMPGGPNGLPLRFPSDYASYQIETGRFKQATETLEQGRGLLWSEMRGLRTSTDRLRRASPALADKFSTINQQLEAVTISVAHSESENLNMGDSEVRTGRREGISNLVTTQRRLLEQRTTLLSHIRSLSNFEDFLKRPSFEALNSAAAHGPVIIINSSEWRSDIIILRKDLSPSVISITSDLYDHANQLKEQLLCVRENKGLDSQDYGDTLAFVLADLYEFVGRLVVETLRDLKVPEKSRVWWCPTGAFCSLPLHAMGPIPSDGGDKVYFMDLYISSYTPTLATLIESHKSCPQLETSDEPSLLLVSQPIAQPETLPEGSDEIRVLEHMGLSVTTLDSEKATPGTVLARLKDHRFVHFVCHGLLETGKPFDASFELHGDKLTLLEIVRSNLPAAEFAFLSACHTAELTQDSIADEGLHLAAAMQFCGFRSVVGTMWAMADTDGAYLSKNFYKSLFSKKGGENGVPQAGPYYERSAQALHLAVKKLRKTRGITLERWVNFVHYGA
ncbi:CHAT domain-containing protein [Lactarius quietus]|nr:CHAT domain-containing protein [Lactarius quietus]